MYLPSLLVYKPFSTKTEKNPRWPPLYDVIIWKLGGNFHFHIEPCVVGNLFLIDNESLPLTTFMVYSFEIKNPKYVVISQYKTLKLFYSYSVFMPFSSTLQTKIHTSLVPSHTKFSTLVPTHILLLCSDRIVDISFTASLMPFFILKTCRKLIFVELYVVCLDVWAGNNT